MAGSEHRNLGRAGRGDIRTRKLCVLPPVLTIPPGIPGVDLGCFELPKGRLRIRMREDRLILGVLLTAP